jgi:hypothetical protein
MLFVRGAVSDTAQSSGKDALTALAFSGAVGGKDGIAETVADVPLPAKLKGVTLK